MPKAVKREEEEEEEDVEDKVQDRSRHCPYLDTINRAVLDFDFEKLCSVSMSNLNVYACLVCGKYFQGRGKNTHAYTHSLQAFHHVYLNLSTLKFYCLPDNYEVIDPSLDDIKYVLKPTFTPEQIEELDHGTKLSIALDGTQYLPVAVGLNNIKANDYVNAVVQCLLHVAPLRQFFLREENYRGVDHPLVTTFGELVRKMCNAHAFKNHVSPHEFLQAVTNASDRKFRLTEQNDPVEFVAWLLNTLHAKLKRGKRSVITDVFQGHMQVTSRKLPPISDSAALPSFDPNAEEYQPKTTDSPFMFLSLDLPPPPLFQDERNIIPQVPLFELLVKFDGVTEKEVKTYKESFMKRFQLTELGDYLIVCIKRFTKNTFFVEKNGTIVNFPVKNIEMRDYLAAAHPGKELPSFKYDLIANIVHDGLPGKGTFRCHVYHKGSKHWYEIQDLNVVEILPQMITLSESYIQVWERQKE